MTSNDYSSLDIDEAFDKLESSSAGLSNDEALLRLKKNGPNSLLQKNHWGWVKNILDPFLNPFAIILIIAAILSSLSGSIKDAIVITTVLVINAFIEYGQRISSGKVLKSLHKYDEAKASVVRSGVIKRIAIEDLVFGDVVELSSGEKVPADGRIISSSGLMVLESMLTGESLPVAKKPEATDKKGEIYQKSNLVFRGSYVAEGAGRFVVTATGSQTQFGQIAALTIDNIESAPIAIKIANLVRLLIIISLLSGIIIFGIGYLQGKDPIELLRFSIALVVSIIPEGLPLTLTVVMLAGIATMARHRVLVRKISAIETLGMVTAIATDKTGTLTEDKLTITKVWKNPVLSEHEFDEQLWLSVGHAGVDKQYSIEKQILDYVEDSAVQPSGWNQVEYLPFIQEKRWSSVIWQKNNQKAKFIKGAPESVLNESKVGVGLRKKIDRQIRLMTSMGMRVVAVAGNKRSQERLHFIGLVGFADRLRPSAKVAVEQAKLAGIAVYMLTGDNTQTAKTIADQVGIARDKEDPMDGAWASRQTVGVLADRLQDVHIFGRVLPEYKYKILEALKLNHITAMTGDGVNDAPALVKADVGIAMGSGTDVAKDAADVVLLDNDFSIIIDAIGQGRRIYANIRKMLIYILCSNFSQTIIIVTTLLLGMPIPFTATMVLIDNLLTDTPMILALGVERGHPDQMNRSPRGAHEPLLAKSDYMRIIYQSIVMALIVFTIYKIILGAEGEMVARIIGFFSLVAVQWSNAFNSRSHRSILLENHRQNIFLWLTVGLGFILAILLVITPLGQYLQITNIGWQMLAIPVLAGIANILLAEVYKFGVKRYQAK